MRLSWLNSAATAAVLALAAFAAGTVPASAHYSTTRCDRDGDQCYTVRCDDDGDNCRRVSSYNSYNRYRYRGRDNRYYDNDDSRRRYDNDDNRRRYDNDDYRRRDRDDNDDE